MSTAMFALTHAENVWGTGGNGSGHGSTLEATAKTRANLLRVIEDLEIDSMIDVPCGGMTWMPLVLEEAEIKRPGFRYLGLDIARKVIDRDIGFFRRCGQQILQLGSKL